MPANTTPIFSRLGDIQWTTIITAANTAVDGTGTVTTAWTADATNGGFLQKLVIRPNGANATATVCRIFINNGSTNATAANNALFAEVTLPITALSQVAAIPGFEIPMNLAMPLGYKINITLGTAPGTGYTVTGVGGKY